MISVFSFHNNLSFFPQHNAIAFSGMFTQGYFKDPIDHYIFDAFRILCRIRKGSFVDDRIRVEYGNVCIIAFRNLSPVLDIESRSLSFPVIL